MLSVFILGLNLSASEPQRPLQSEMDKLDALKFVLSEVAFDARVVTGAPYQAKAISEYIHALGDGNRIYLTAIIEREGDGYVALCPEPASGTLSRKHARTCAKRWSSSSSVPRPRKCPGDFMERYTLLQLEIAVA